MKHRLRTILIGLALGVVLLVVGAIVVVDRHSTDTTAPSGIDRSSPAEIAAAINPSSQTLDQLISGLQARLARTPKDDVSWATLALAYVQQAKVTVDPSYYPKADGAIATSRSVNDRDNYLADLAASAVASARHDFAGAKAAAQQGLQIDSYSPLLYGALSDAEIQLGDYTAGFAAIDKMISLQPDTAS